MKYISKNLFVLLLIAGLSTGCEDFLTPSVDQEILTEEAVNNAQDLRAVVNGIHDRLTSTTMYRRNFPINMEVMSHNAWSTNRTGRFGFEQQMNFTEDGLGTLGGVWNSLYAIIANANVAINADIESSPEVDHIKGQAYALRAFAHMQLLMLFGQQYVSGGDPSLGIPYITTYSEGNLYPARDPIATVWTNINSDFGTAIELMDPNIEELVYIDYWSTRALQTRSYLYQESYNDVITIAEDIINNSGFTITPAADLIQTWAGTTGKPGAMFELSYIPTDASQFDNIANILHDTDYGDVQATEDLYNAHDPNDIRLDLYAVADEAGDGNLDYRMVGKYTDFNTGTDNVPVIRYPEVVLNYAEALAATSNEPDALVELTKITDNRNAPAYATGSIENVWNERRIELAFEGHGFLDLVRTGRDILEVNPNQNRGTITAGSYKFALPIPGDEMDANSSMVQNLGYQP